MKQITHQRTPRRGMTLLIITILATFLVPLITIHADDSYSYDESLKEMNFNLHTLDEPVIIGGQETKYNLDTTNTYRFTTQAQARAGSLLKPIGLPKIALNFFLNPPLTTPVKFEGQWKASIWVNGTAYKPISFSISLQELSQNGTILYETGQQSPTVISSIGEHIDVPVTNYILVAPLKHTFQNGSTIQTTIEINSGSSSETRVWFDSPLYPSKITLPSTDYARPVTIKTYAADGTPSNNFDIDAPADKRAITIRTNITDPYGAYDIASAKATIYYNNTQQIAGHITMALTKSNPTTELYSTVWTIPNNALPGNYTVEVNVQDNNGQIHSQQTGAPEPYTEQGTHTFQIGAITYLNPTIKITDDAGAPVTDAQILVTYPNGARDELPRHTNINGTITLTKVIPADYTFTVLWKNSLVAYSKIKIESNGPYNVTTKIYSLKITVNDNTAKPVPGAYVFAYRDKLGYGFDTTDTTGQVSLRVPEGTYDIETHYTNSYLLSPVSTNINKPGILVSTSTSLTLTLTDYPPPIWTTTGFILLIIGLIMFIIILLIIRRN